MGDQIGAWLFAKSGTTHLGVLYLVLLGYGLARLERQYVGKLNLPRSIRMSLLTRDQILTADDLVTETVKCPEWGGDVLVRSLTGTERDAYESQIRGSDGSSDKPKPRLDQVRSGLVAKAIIDQDGQRVFSDADVVKLGMKNALVINRVFEVIARLSGLAEDEQDKEAEDFGDGPSGPSSTD